MKKRIISVAIALMMLLSFALTASANSDHIFDMGNHLTDSEMSELEVYAQNIENNYGYCVMFGIIDSLDRDLYETTYDYAEYVYESVGDRDNGIVIVTDEWFTPRKNNKNKRSNHTNFTNFSVTQLVTDELEKFYDF